MPETEIYKKFDFEDDVRLAPGPLARRAIIETAIEIGGEDFAKEVSTKFTSEELLADDGAVQHLEIKVPQAKKLVVEKLGSLQQESNELDEAGAKLSNFKKIGSSVINFIKRN